MEVRSIGARLGDARNAPLVRALYGSDPQRLAAQIARWEQLARDFTARFPEHTDAQLISAPGRTEIGGNHTDHQRGRVLCASVDLDLIALAAPNGESVIRLRSAGFNKEDRIDLADLSPQPDERGHSASLIRGIAAAMRQRGMRIGGFDAYTASAVPKGSGLSSSAAFEMAVVTIIDQLYNGGRIDPLLRARIGQYAENVYFGKPSGLLDQSASSIGNILTIDFARADDPKVRELPVDFSRFGHALIIVDSGGSHADLTEDYAAIPADMRKAAAWFGADVLSEVDPHRFLAELPALRADVGDLPVLRAMHFFQDSARVIRQADALESGDFETFLALIRESGISSWTQLQNVYAPRHPNDQAVAVALSASQAVLAGRGACRVHGGGFAGTIQAFVPQDLVPEYLSAMRALCGPTAAQEMRIRPVGACALHLAR